ncbi:MAG: TfoX/Sxy family protein [Pseudomonadota bacterium]
MDREFLQDLFSAFGPVSLRRMFSGYGVSVDGVNFALVLRGGIYFRTDGQTVARFEEEGAKPFQYETRNKVVTVASYWQLPDRLYDDPEELADWARAALGAAERAAATKRSRAARRGAAGAGRAAAGSSAGAQPKLPGRRAKAGPAKTAPSRKPPSPKKSENKRSGTKTQSKKRRATTAGVAARKNPARKSRR